MKVSWRYFSMNTISFGVNLGISFFLTRISMDGYCLWKWFVSGTWLIHIDTADILFPLCFFGVSVLQIKSHWKQRELTAKSWDSYVSRTSNYEILKVSIFNIIDITSSHHCCYKQSITSFFFLLLFCTGGKSSEGEIHWIIQTEIKAWEGCS